MSLIQASKGRAFEGLLYGLLRFSKDQTELLARQESMTTDLESTNSTELEVPQTKPANWLKVALVTTGSALIGGIAAAWWYRKTLVKLRETGESRQNSYFGIPESQRGGGTEDEV
jgi:hypothetical protein